MALLTRRTRDAGGETELLAARIERSTAYAEHAAAEEARLAAHGPENQASYLDKLSTSAAEFRARNRLMEADRRLRQIEEFDRLRRKEVFEDRLRPLCREGIELLKQAERIEVEKSRIILEANEAGVALSQDWVFIPVAPEPIADESAFQVWQRWLAPRL